MKDYDASQPEPENKVLYGCEYIHPDDNRSVLTHEELPWLTLITCQGYDEDIDSYRWHIAVRAVQIKIDRQ